MATPTSLPASFSTGAVLTAAQMNDLRGAFRILQIVGGTSTNNTSVSSTTFIDTTLSATITPQATSSKILVLISQSFYNNAGNTEADIRLVRGSTTLFTHGNGWVNSSALLSMSWPCIYLDSPNTTSATTYKTQFNRATGTGSMFAQINSNISSIILCEVSA